MEEYEVDQVYVAISNINNDKLIAILEFLKKRNIKTKFVPNLYRVFIRHMQINKVGEIPIVSEVDLAKDPILKLMGIADLEPFSSDIDQELYGQ